MKNIVIIGAGASGMMAAISAAREAGKKEKEVRITILEHEDQVGKKILVTGNGRCNLSNRILNENCYHSSKPMFPMQVIESFDGTRTEDFFRSIGILYKERNGYLYPNSGQASTVRDILLKELEHYGIKLHLNTHAANILRDPNGFKVYTDTYYAYPADCVILASGTSAGGVSGADITGLNMAERLGNPVITLLPSLVQIRSRDACCQKFAGIRHEGCVTLYRKARGIPAASEYGEIQFTENGISGIPVFQLSGICAELLNQGEELECRIDFLPGFKEEKLHEYLMKRVEDLAHKQIGDFLDGMLPDKLCGVLLKHCGFHLKNPVFILNENDIFVLCQCLKGFPISVFETNSLKSAQVARGGVDPHYIDSQTMESTLVPGLFFAGEMIDVDGRCGGYNLQWAWSSGYLAGVHAV